MKILIPIRWVVLLLGTFLFMSLTAQGANICVGPSASGNGSGSDWNNIMAWNGTPARGDTWYLENGSYSSQTFSVATSGSTLITIKKATVADHGTSTGWSDAMAGQSLFTGEIGFESSYWVFDGQTGGGAGNWNGNVTPFGFKIYEPTDGAALIRIGYVNSGIHDITVRHVDMQGEGGPSSSGGAYSNDGIAIYYNVTNVTVSFVWMHGIGRCPVFMTDGAGNVLFEGFYVQSYFGSSSVHSEVLSDGGGSNSTGDTTFRNSLVVDIESTGGLMWDNGGTPTSHLYVYGNVFYKPSGAVWSLANGVIGGWTGANGEQMYNVYVYNNTFVNIDYLPLGNFPQVYGGCMAKNNLFYGTVAPDFSLFTPHDYNQFVNSGTTQGEANGSAAAVSLNNYTGLDFTLTANTTAGTNLGSPYNIDPLGKTRSTWTRGAYEYGTISTNPVISVSPNGINFGSVLTNTVSSQTFIVQNTGGGTLTGTATVSGPFSIVAGGTYSLNANQSQNVTVGFSPKAPGLVTNTVTFTGGRGITETMSGTGISNYPAPQVSAITQSGSDVDSGKSGVQVFAGSTEQYSGSASDPSGLPLSWQWIYTVNGGSEIVFQSGTGAVASVSFNFTTNFAGNTCVWKLRVSNRFATAESDLTVGVEAPPVAGGGLVFAATSGVLTAPFVATNGYVSQAVSTDVTIGGQAVYSFTITNAGNYVIQASVDATSLSANSFYVNIDAQPQDPSMIWDINPVTSDFEQRLVSWRGNGAAEADQFVPEIFNLTAGMHQLIIVGREPGAQLQSLSILQLPSAPQNLHILQSL